VLVEFFKAFASTAPVQKTGGKSLDEGEGNSAQRRSQERTDSIFVLACRLMLSLDRKFHQHRGFNRRVVIVRATAGSRKAEFVIKRDGGRVLFAYFEQNMTHARSGFSL